MTTGLILGLGLGSLGVRQCDLEMTLFLPLLLSVHVLSDYPVSCPVAFPLIFLWLGLTHCCLSFLPSPSSVKQDCIPHIYINNILNLSVARTFATRQVACQALVLRQTMGAHHSKLILLEPSNGMATPISVINVNGPNSSSCGYCGPPGVRSSAQSSYTYGISPMQLSCSVSEPLLWNSLGG